jgi:HEAT repeat protein
MNLPYRTVAGLALAVCLTGVSLTAKAGPRLRQDEPFVKLKSYDFQDRQAVQAALDMIQQAQGDKAKTAQIEQQLIGVLQAPDATVAGKQEACRMLWIVGTVRSVPTLAKMLPDEKLSDMARYALERNADPAAGRALLAALKITQGKTQIGIINSIGDRGDADAVAALKPLVKSATPLAAEAAIAALGKIGTPEAVVVLRSLPADKPLVGHALLRSAERWAAAGNKAAAENLYIALTEAKYPPVIQAEALRGLATAQSPRAVTVALADLKSSDYGLQQVAARIGGGLTGPQATGRFVDAWSTLAPPAQIVLLTAFVDRRETAAAPLAERAIESQDAGLRRAGIQAESLLGGAKAVPQLVDLAVQGQGEDRDVARNSLAHMPGADAEKAILQLAQQGSPEQRATLMGVLADRPTPPAVAVLVASIGGPDERVAVEAARALGRVGGPNEQDPLLTLLTSTHSDSLRDAAKDAAISIGQRLPDRNAIAVAPLTHYINADNAGKAALLPVLAASGNGDALRELARATEASDAELKQAAVTALADSWSDDRALPTLLNLAKSDGDKAIRVQALRGGLRIIAQDDRAPADTRADRIADALKIAERPEEKKQALSILRDCRTERAAQLAASLLDDPELFPEAADTVLYLAAPRRKDNRDEPAVKGPAMTAALDKVIQLTKDDSQRALAQKLKG